MGLHVDRFASFVRCRLLLLQIALDNDDDIYQYEDVTVVEGSVVNSDLLFSANHSHLYVMTTNKVSDRRGKDIGRIEGVQPPHLPPRPHVGYVQNRREMWGNPSPEYTQSLTCPSQTAPS